MPMMERALNEGPRLAPWLWLLALVGCGEPPGEVAAPPCPWEVGGCQERVDPPPDPTPDWFVGVSGGVWRQADALAPEVFRLGASASHLAMPFVPQGQRPEPAPLTLAALGRGGSPGPLTVHVEGDFAVEGSLAPMASGQLRHLQVHYTGPVDAPRLAYGELWIGAGQQGVPIEVAAVIGDGALPEVTWRAHPEGLVAVAPMPSAPYPHEAGPWEDSSVLMFIPDAFTGRGPVHLVTHFHGLRSEVVPTVERQRLMELFARAGRDAILVAPQGPLRAGSNAFGKLDEPGGFERLVRDVVTLLYRDGLVAWPRPGQVALTAHSGGYKPTARVIERGGVPIASAHLFDALYGEEDIYEGFALGGGVLRSLHTPNGGTVDNNLALIETLREAGHPVSTSPHDGALLEFETLILPTTSSHDGCLRDRQTYARWLATCGLPRAPLAPPEILLAVADERGQARVRWRDDAQGEPLQIRVEGSEDGLRWEPLAWTRAQEALVSARPWLRLIAEDPLMGDSQPSDRYGATGGGWLVVDGFDRSIDGSWRLPTHGFAAALGQALGTSFSTASDDAVVEELVDIGDFDGVLWFLGDEGRADETFPAEAREALSRYVEGGGRLIVTGSEVGYATDPGWLGAVLRVGFVEDDARTEQAGGYRFGVTYEEDFPDVLEGQEVIWAYDNGRGAAAVGWERRVVVVGFGLETLGDEQRPRAMGELLRWLRPEP